MQYFVFFNKEIRKIVFVSIYYLYNMSVIKYMYNKGSEKLSYVIEIAIKQERNYTPRHSAQIPPLVFVKKSININIKPTASS